MRRAAGRGCPVNTSQRISRVIGVLQQHERLHGVIRELLMRHSNAGFMVARSGMTAPQKWAALEVQRCDLLGVLCDVADCERIALPAECRTPREEVPHAAD